MPCIYQSENLVLRSRRILMRCGDTGALIKAQGRWGIAHIRTNFAEWVQMPFMCYRHCSNTPDACCARAGARALPHIAEKALDRPQAALAHSSSASARPLPGRTRAGLTVRDGSRFLGTAGREPPGSTRWHGP